MKLFAGTKLSLPNIYYPDLDRFVAELICEVLFKSKTLDSYLLFTFSLLLASNLLGLSPSLSLFSFVFNCVGGLKELIKPLTFYSGGGRLETFYSSCPPNIYGDTFLLGRAFILLFSE